MGRQREARRGLGPLGDLSSPIGSDQDGLQQGEKKVVLESR